MPIGIDTHLLYPNTPTNLLLLVANCTLILELLYLGTDHIRSVDLGLEHASIHRMPSNTRSVE